MLTIYKHKAKNDLSFDMIKQITGDNEDLFFRVLKSFKVTASRSIPILEAYPDAITEEELYWLIEEIKPSMDYFGLSSAKNCLNIKNIIQGEMHGDIKAEINKVLDQLNKFNQVVRDSYHI